MTQNARHDEFREVFKRVEALAEVNTHQAREELQALHSKVQTELYGGYRFAILNAIPRELAAVSQVFGPAVKIPVSRGEQSYDVVTLRKKNGSDLKVVIAGTSDQGLTVTAAVTAALIQSLPFAKSIMLVGIAAGQPNLRDGEKDVMLGDIVVSKEIVQYDHIKREAENKITPRAPLIRTPNTKLLSVARGLKADMEQTPGGPWAWEGVIGECVAASAQYARPARDPKKEAKDKQVRKYSIPSLHRQSFDRPHLHIGTIASANILLKDPVYRDSINDTYKAIAFEMEGAGLAITAAHLEAEYIVVRGICDYGDMSKNDDWQKYASLAAAAVGKVLLERL